MPVAVVSGVMAGKPNNGGNAWSRLSFVLGLRRLGFDVVFVEQIDAAQHESETFFQSVCARFEIEGYLIAQEASSELLSRLANASVLINIGGHLDPALCRSRTAIRVFIDDDP